MRHGYFITGTDTEIGKTFTACALLHAARGAGYSALAMKPVAAGIEADGENEDVRRLMAAASVAAPRDLVNPYLYAPPIAPHIAAVEAGRPIETAVIRQAFAALQPLAEVVLVEGVGGFRVPLGPDLDAADLAVALQLPVILVVGMRLGCINHALLSAESIIARDLPLVGWVANQIDPAMSRFEENLATLDRLLPAPRLGTLAYQANPDPAVAAIDLRLP
ncbi:MAG TPA: dethiobiotin synthase [Azospira sp.]|nr:dethiobiotin synthase [Azospira sp.]